MVPALISSAFPPTGCWSRMWRVRSMRCSPWKKRSGAAGSRRGSRNSPIHRTSPRHDGSRSRRAAAASGCCCATKRATHQALHARAGRSPPRPACRINSADLAAPPLRFRSPAPAAVPAATGHSHGTTMNTPSRRYLSVWMRRLPTDRIAKRFAPDEALVVAAPVKNALRLCAVNDAAASLALTAGMSLADARARYPKIAVAKVDEAADLALLEAAADWCDRYTPLVGLDAPDGLTLDISGCAHLFGGEATMADDLVRRLGAHGLKARAAVADTVGCAWGVARYGKASIIASDDTRDAFAP